MSAELLAFPHSPPPASPPLAPVANPRREYGLGEMARLLALTGLSRRCQIDRLRLLAEQCRLPLPRNPRVFRRRVQSGPAAIGAGSRWCALEVDAWLDAPPLPAAAEPPPLPGLRAAMAARAAELAAAGGARA